MADFTVYETNTGRIISIAVGASSPADLELTPDQSVIDGAYSARDYWIDNGVAVLRPLSNITVDKTSITVGEPSLFSNTSTGIFNVRPISTDAINVYEAESFEINDSSVQFIADKPATFDIVINDEFPKQDFITTIIVSK